MAPTAFIVHGHDKLTKSALKDVLSALAVDVIAFHRAGPNDMSGTNLKAVLGGIKRATVVFLLFTPEEQAAFYDPGTGQYVSDASTAAGWQPRPNVLLEAGVAAAVAKTKTAILKFGHIRRISDLDGVRRIDLEDSVAVQQIWRFIKEKVHELRDLPLDAAERFRRKLDVVRVQRWDYHDELGQLEAELRIPFSGSKTFVDVLAEFVRNHPEESSWNNRTITDFFLQRYDYSRDQHPTDGFFWNLVIHGVFALTDIESWAQRRKHLWWHELELNDDVTLAPRGRALLRRLKATGPARRAASTRT